MANSNRNGKIRIVEKCRQKISITPLEEKKKMPTKTIAYCKFESSPKSRILPKKVKFKNRQLRGRNLNFGIYQAKNGFIGSGLT